MKKRSKLIFLLLVILSTLIGLGAYYMFNQAIIRDQIAVSESIVQEQEDIRKEIIAAEKRRLAEITIENLTRDTNEEREQLGLTKLTVNSSLNTSAQAKANDMAARNYWGHNTPEGNPPWGFINNTGYSYTKAAENLACGFGDAQAIVNSWMKSPTHRVNMVDPVFTDVGFGIVRADSYECGDWPKSPQTVVVQHFGTPLY